MVGTSTQLPSNGAANALLAAKEVVNDAMPWVAPALALVAQSAVGQALSKNGMTHIKRPTSLLQGYDSVEDQKRRAEIIKREALNLQVTNKQVKSQE
jgi:hypothetical protein